MPLNAMRADAIVIRHASSGAVQLIADKVDCPVLNAGDGRHEHPTQALLDALTIRRRLGRVEGLTIAICGDVLHSRVARSNILALTLLGNEVRVVAPPTLTPPAMERRSEEHTSELQSLMRISYAVFCLKKKKNNNKINYRR